MAKTPLIYTLIGNRTTIAINASFNRFIPISGKKALARSIWRDSGGHVPSWYREQSFGLRKPDFERDVNALHYKLNSSRTIESVMAPG